jgi:predicted DNA-binding transcriptional regulator AlpA
VSRSTRRTEARVKVRSKSRKTDPKSNQHARFQPGIGHCAVLGRFTLRLDEVATAIGISRRALERERSAGRFPKPDLRIGRMPLWRLETILAWIERGGGAC